VWCAEQPSFIAQDRGNNLLAGLAANHAPTASVELVERCNRLGIRNAKVERKAIAKRNLPIKQSKRFGPGQMERAKYGLSISLQGRINADIQRSSLRHDEPPGQNVMRFALHGKGLYMYMPCFLMLTMAM
jgi:hypothetical protein